MSSKCARVGCRRKGKYMKEFLAKQNKKFGEFAWVMVCEDHRK